MNSDLMNQDPNTLHLKSIETELAGLKKVVSYLWDGNQQAFNAIIFIKGNYKEWAAMLQWLKHNNLKGQRLVEFFQNASHDGGGYHMGATHIISRLDGLKHNTRTIKIDELS